MPRYTLVAGGSMPKDALVVVAEFRDRIEAEVAHGALAAAEIESVLSSDDIGGQYPGVWAGGVKLLVRAADEQTARDVLGS